MKSRNRKVPKGPRIDRRTALGWLAGGATTLASSLIGGRGVANEQPPRSTLGVVAYCCSIRRQAMRASDPNFDLFEPRTFLQHCRELGAGGIQAALGVLDAVRVKSLREVAEDQDMFIEAIVSPPRDPADLDRFQAEIQTARDVGALSARTVVMPGRRYEQFKTLAEFREAAARAEKMLELAAPIVEKHHVPLAVENHKDQRIDERLSLYKRLSCEYIGACVDTGNSFALLDDPYETIEALAPFAFSVHLKDQAVREYNEGFLLGDIPLGAGCFNLEQMVAMLRKAKPKLRFVLEMITRDPLRVPCLSERYWATVPTVPGSDLARTLRIVRKNPAETLQQVSMLSLEQQVALEDANVRASLNHARAELGF